MKKFHFSRIILLIFICGCCVDPFNLALSINKALVVDGVLTDQVGPQVVTLSYSSPIGIGNFDRELIAGAGVVIVDDEGAQTQLFEISKGTYQTDSAFAARPGKNYFVRITLNNEIYESDMETLLPVGQLDSLFFELQANSSVNQFQIYTNSTRPQQSAGMMRWRSSYTYQIQTQPYNSSEPPACSGVTTNPKTLCTCCICWVSGKNTDVVISNSSNFLGDNYNNNLVATIPLGAEQFEFKYYLTVDQLSLSTNAYTFWNLVMSQQKGASSLFQPVSFPIPGNMHSRTNPNEQVFGFFQVSSVTSKSIFINRSDVPFNLQPQLPRNVTDCRVSGGTTISPPFW